MFESAIDETFEDPTLAPKMDDFFRNLQKHYGACWGTLKFEDSSGAYSNKASSFLYVDDNIDLHLLYRFMFHEWELETPDIVIPVFNSITSHKAIETLKNGIRNAANTSNLWFITNSLDASLPRLIGTTFRNEILARRAEDAWAKHIGRKSKRRTELTLIGIVCDKDVKDAIAVESTKSNSPMDVKVQTRRCDISSLNSDHTHFIILREHRSSSNDENQNEKAINRFRDRFEDFLHHKMSQQQTTSSPVTTMDMNLQNKDGLPMVCILIGGTMGTMEFLYEKIQQEIPVVILKETGAAADMIAFAYEESSLEKIQLFSRNDEEFQENYLKVELVRRLIDEYPELKHSDVKRDEVRDFLISIVKDADREKRKLLTFVDVNRTKASSNDFCEILLSALLQSQRPVPAQKLNAQFKRNLLLALNWNLPDLATSIIFPGHDYIDEPIPADMFDKAILQQKYEPFVDLFLDQGFVLHRYLKSDKLVDLFNQAKDRDFFTTTSLEGILGFLSGDKEKMPENFADHHLNTIVKHLTGISYFFSKHEMDFNAMGMYLADINDRGTQGQRTKAEKQALRYLIVYAVLMNRHQLAILLWKRSSEPVQMTLICSMMFEKLASYCPLSYQRSTIEKQAKVFGDYAVEVLDKSFNEDVCSAMTLLDQKYPDWNDSTTIELAYFSENRKFLSHAACQKWIARQFYGRIAPRNLSWGLFKCSDYFKVITSAFFIFPMWFWICLSPSSTTTTTTTELRKSKPFNHVDEIRLLWNAPITKFCTSFVAYLLYLCLFTLAVMWPSCGNFVLDCLVWIWTALLVCEDVRANCRRYHFKRALVKLIIQTIFLALFLFIRIIGLWWFGTCQIVAAKAILGIGLIYYYYRIIYIFLPMSSRFGPLLLGLRHRILDDFFTVLQLFAIFMVSSSVAITAVVYPHHPLDSDLFSRIFIFRGLMALFTSETTDLKIQYQSCSINATGLFDREYSCLRLAHGRSFHYNNLYAYHHYGIPSPRCNQTSWIAWFLLIQYFLLIKRFLGSLLTAMFTLTGIRVQNQSEPFWNYYRCGIIMEYRRRPRLPPPLVIISYIEMLILKIGRRCVTRLAQNSDRGPATPNDEADLFWKNKAKQCDTGEKSETDEVQEKLNRIWNSVSNGQKDMNVVQNSLREINHRIFSLEKLRTESHASLAEPDEKTHKKLMHVRSRESPYIYTSEGRFPVTEKFILWTVPYDCYDPTLITLPKEHICFEHDERPFIEPDLLERSSTDSSDSTIPASSYKWNETVEWQWANDKMIIDRKTWITNPNTKTSTTYPVDTQLNIPLNPIGRTGVRGRGALIRWGPNKFIMGMITRWKSHHDQFVIVDGQRILEAMLFKDTITSDWKLPVGKMLGVESPYAVFCRTFNKLAFQKDDPERSLPSQEQDMIKYFASFARNGDKNERMSAFQSHLAYKGYIDDVRNTDNAWVEAEIWNFHYDHNMSFCHLRNDNTVFWKDMTYNLHTFPLQTSILREIARIHNAYIE